MKPVQRVLVPVDDSSASERAVAYAGKMLAENENCRIRLFHVEEPIGPYFYALHSEEASEKQEAGSAAEHELIRKARERSEPVLKRMADILKREGLNGDRTETSWFVASREDDLVAETLQVAREQNYRTIIVGRSVLPWYGELFHRHFGARLVEHGEGLTVWVVG